MVGREIGVSDRYARLLPPDPETYLIEVERGALGSLYRAWRLGGIKPHLLADSTGSTRRSTPCG